MDPSVHGDDIALTVHEASKRYAVSKAVLQARLSRGEIPATKVRGSRGYEWRVKAEALEAFGCRPRDAPPATDAVIEDVLRELLSLSDALIAEQQRAAEQQRSIEAMRQQIHRLRRTMHEVLQSERSKR